LPLIPFVAVKKQQHYKSEGSSDEYETLEGIENCICDL
jgi:hypothetical protein